MNRWSKVYLWFNLALVGVGVCAFATIFAFPKFGAVAEIALAIAVGLITIMQFWQYYGGDR
jgi:spore maturation protein SpmA